MSERIFNAYSAYYDLLYQDKDYEAETKYLLELLSRHSPACPRTVLDLGCGSGRHAVWMARRGVDATGIELSQEMLERAKSATQGLTPNVAAKVRFLPGDARTVRTGRSYDAVTSLFHVASYQTSNEDLGSFFSTAAAHLDPGGLFVFDCWYGPAVLRTMPEQRIKEVSNDAARVVRFARPTLRVNDNIVDVHYRVFASPTDSSGWTEFEESHAMRYLFLPELEMFLGAAGLRLLASEEFLTGRPIGASCWNACLVARKN